MTAVASSIKNFRVTTIAFDIVTLLLIYLVPSISHFLSVPLYLIEPMRLMLILSLAHTGRTNSYLLALTLPLFSFLVSGHPELVKMLLITAELTLAVWIFDNLMKKAGNVLMASFAAIIFSKVFYYTLKFLMIKLSFLDMQLVSTPLYIQAITSVFFSGYLYLVLRNKL